MYSDPITPRAFPDLLQKADYDPFHVMPAEFPSHPRMSTSAAKLAKCAARLARNDIPTVTAWKLLQSRNKLDEVLPAIPAKPELAFAALSGNKALRFALIDRIAPDPAFRERALHHLRRAAGILTGLAASGFEMDMVWNCAGAYDLLAAGPLSPADDAMFRAMLTACLPPLNNNPHHTCNNQSSFHMLSRLAVGSALGDRQVLHDALYGYEHDGKWRYGLIHLLRHDFLADGMHWEGAMGYHMLVMLSSSEMLTIMEHLGIDLWHRELPPLTHDDGFDQHRGYGPKGTRCFKDTFDAFFYQAFPNGDYSLLHDQVLGNIRGAYAWASLFNKAFEVYGDPKYAWLLHRMREQYPETNENPQPIWFHNSRGDIEFARLDNLTYPPGRFSFADDVKISQSGRHMAGCSLFPVHGTAVLRANPESTDSPAAYFYFGPHWAGHRGPGALHLDLHAGGHRLTSAPHIFDKGYDDPRHLTWNRTTIAHNTVTVDETSMFPYDFESESLWECDWWRDRISDGKLEFFQPDGAGFKAVRASNNNVYEDINLDRTVVLTNDYAIDLYRATGHGIHCYDWTMHTLLPFQDAPADARPVALGDARGYRHLSNARQWRTKPGWLALAMSDGTMSAVCNLHLSKDMAFITADEMEIDTRAPIAYSGREPQRKTLIIRTRQTHALFAVIWSFGTTQWHMGRIKGQADTDVSLTLTSTAGAAVKWRLPLNGPVKCSR